MKTISLEEAVYELLDNCTAVVYGSEGNLAYPAIDDLNNDEDNIFLSLSNGETEPLLFAEGANETVSIDNDQLYLTDTHGEIYALTLLVPNTDLEAPFATDLEDDEDEE
jgi:hypothetical protein